MSQPKIFNINRKNNFEQQNNKLLKTSTNDLLLSGKWMK